MPPNRKRRLRAILLGFVLAPALTGVALAQGTPLCGEMGEEEAAAPQSPPPRVPPTNNTSSHADSLQPLTVGGKFQYALGRGFGPFSALSAFAVAGYQQYFDLNKGFGQGADGYFSRVGSNYGKTSAKHLVGSFMLASIFRQDPRYHPSNRTGWGRVGYAVSRVVVTRSDSGASQFNVHSVGGAFAAGFIARSWHHPPDDTAARALSRSLSSLGMEAVRNVFREFWPDIRRRLRR